MRLTLRTLLAYMDNILEQADSSNLEEKIRESEFAKSLMERMRRVSVQPDLGAPPANGRGVARDPSSVAEYLDNTMAPEQIQEFERICLESDVHLAEVTGCHNVLTMVLGQPAKVSAAMRERMYSLNEGTVMRLQDELQSQPADEPELDQEPPALPTSTAVAAALATPPAEHDAADIWKPMPQAPPAPDQPQPASDSRFWVAMVLTAAIAAALTGILFMAFDSGSADGDKGKTGQIAKKDQQAAPGDVAADQAGGDDNPLADGPERDLADAPDDSAAATSPLDPLSPADPLATDATSAPKDAADQPAAEPSTAGDAPPATGDGAADSAPPAADAPDAAASEPDPAADELPTEAGPDVIVPGDTEPEMADQPAGDALAKADGDTGPPPPGDDGATEPGTDETTLRDPPATAPVIVGRLLSHDQVLLHSNATMDELTRLPDQAPLNIGDRLIALPAFRPMISATSTTIELEGGSSIELSGVDADRVPEITIHYGRVIVRSLATPNTRLRIQLGQQTGTLVFNNADSAVGIEVRPYLIAGRDPENSPPTHAVDLYIVQGTVTWATADAERSLQAPVRVTLAPHPFEPSGGEDQPAWLTQSTLTALDKRGITEIEQRLRPDRSITLSLSELAEHRRWEIRRLAMRASGHVQYFEPLVNALSDPELYSRWYTVFVPELTAAVARGPAVAAQVRKTFEKSRGESAAELYRMLWGYSRDDLIAGGQARKLVEYLDHEQLDFRVLSFGNLQQITGLGMNYRPEDNELQRKQSVQRWSKKAEKGEIVPQGTAPPGGS